MERNHPSQRGVWLAIILLASLPVAAAAGALFYIAEAAPQAVMGASGATYMGAVTLGLAAHRFLTE
jgi:hypothetical protein